MVVVVIRVVVVIIIIIVMITVIIINITLSSNVIGLKDYVFSTNWLPIM